MKVLIATDGTDFSQKAVDKCCRMFDESVNTELRIISAAVPVSIGMEPFGLSAAFYGDLEKAAETVAEDAIKTAESEVKRHPDLTTALSTEVIKGSPNQVIVDEAERWGADLIVMGSHGYGFWQRALLGSVSDSVVRHAPCSVLVVRENGA